MNELQKFALEHKPMFWDVSCETLGNMSDQAIVERFFCYGDWDEYKTLEKILGISAIKDIFIRRAYMPRTNLREETISFFSDYYAKYAS